MTVSDHMQIRNRRKFNQQYDATVKVEHKLRIIIAYLDNILNDGVLDWQERDRMKRAIEQITMTQTVLAASLSRNVEARQSG